jgi:sulfur-carrier protein
MKIQFFGKLGDRLGREREISIPPHVQDVAALRRLLAERVPEAEVELMDPSLRACVDDLMVADDHHLEEGSEVAFFPPLSGG